MHKKHVIAFVFKLLLFSDLVYYTNCIKWESFMESAFSGTKELSEIIQPYLEENFSSENVSTQCTNSLIKYADGIKNWKPWAIKMFDATGKLRSGFLRGSTLDVGSFDECLAIRVKTSDKADDFKGKFCMLHLKSPLFSSVKRKQANGKSYIETYGYPPDWVNETTEIMQNGFLEIFGPFLGICVPSTCTDQELYHVFTSLTQAADLQVSLTDCQISESKKWPKSSKIAVVILAVLVGFVVIGTISDLLDQEENNESEKNNLLKAFSVKRNFKSLFKTKTTDSPLDFISGFKAVLLVWMLALHAFGYPTLYREIRFNNIHAATKKLQGFMIVFENAIINTGYFMFLSGFLISYSMHQKSTEMQIKKTKSNMFSAFFMKYIRNTLLQIFLIIITFAFPLIYDGPFWNSTWENKISKCRRFSWLNLLYVNNYGTFDHMCWEHTWFVSALMQLQIICAGLLFISKRYPRTGVILGLLISAACLIRDFNVSLKNKFLFPTIQDMKSHSVLRDYVEKIYLRTHHHFIVYVTGMVIGRLNLGNYKPKKIFVIIAWILYIISSITLFFLVKLPTRNLTIIALHNSFRSILLSFQMALITFLCLTKSAGIFGTFLEWKGFVPLSKLMLSITLFHPILLVAAEGSMRESFYLSTANTVILSVQFIVPCCIFGLIIYLFIEAPLNRLCDLLEGKDAENSLENSKMSNHHGKKYSKSGIIKKET